MRSPIYLLAALPATLVATVALAGQTHGTLPLETCLQSAKSVRQGDIVKVDIEGDNIVFERVPGPDPNSDDPNPGPA